MLAIAWGGLASAAAGQIPCAYQISAVIEGPKCQILGQRSIFGLAINAKGHVAGYYGSCVEPADHEAFVWTPEGGRFTIPRPANVFSAIANDISDDDIVVGTCQIISTDGPLRGFVYDFKTNTWTILHPANGIGECQVLGINSQNIVCGYRSMGNLKHPNYPWTAFTWSQDKGIMDLGQMGDWGSTALDINSQGTVVGYLDFAASDSTRGFIYQAGSITLVPPVSGGLNSSVSCINDHGLMLVGGVLQLEPPYDSQSYLTDGISSTQLFPLPGFHNPGPIGISNSGVIVGRSHNPIGDEGRATVWVDGVPSDLNAYVPQGSDLIFEYAGGIGNGGHIVVTGRYGIGMPAVTIVLTPLTLKSGDTDCNDRVDMDDILHVITAWGPCLGCSADLNGDQSVNVQDLMLVITNWDFNR